MKEDLTIKVKRILDEELDPFFSGITFKRRGNEYFKREDQCVKHIVFRFDLQRLKDGLCYYFANIEFNEVERLVNLGVVDEDSVNTIGKQMGYLSGRKFERWPITHKVDVHKFGRMVIDHLQNFGLPFVEKFCSLEAVKVALEGGELFNLDVRDAQMKLAAIYYLQGQKARALQLLDENIRGQEGRTQQGRFIQLRQFIDQLQ